MAYGGEGGGAQQQAGQARPRQTRAGHTALAATGQDRAGQGRSGHAAPAELYFY